MTINKFKEQLFKVFGDKIQAIEISNRDQQVTLYARRDSNGIELWYDYDLSDQGLKNATKAIKAFLA